MQKTILTVDDSSTMRKMISFTLKDAGYNVLEAEDGNEALKILASQPASMIITDVNMPNMDGIELTRRVRQMDAYKSIPIVLLTTESAQDKKAEGKTAGATGWIVKPFQEAQLLNVLSKVLA